MLFSGTKEECEQLVSWLNSLMPGVVTFKFEFSFQKIQFLDLEIYQEDGKLKTNIYVKPSNKQLYLDFHSNHPDHCKNAIPYSQALRVVEKCSDKELMDTELVKLKEKFRERNYSEQLLGEKFGQAKKKDRRNLIFQDRKNNKKETKKVRLMFTHNQSNPPIHKWLRLCKPILDKNEVAKDIGSRIQICTKQPRNLQAILGGCKEGRVSQEIPADAGCSKCEKGCKVSCPMIKEGKIFQSTRTKKSYKIKQKLNCESDWLIYLITCKKCSCQYVGKSKTV